MTSDKVAWVYTVGDYIRMSNCTKLDREEVKYEAEFKAIS